MLNPREIAFEALLKTEKDKAYSNLALDFCLSENNLDTRDKSFVSNLFYGSIERKLTLDYNLSLYLEKPIKKLKPEVLVLLRMGTYQLLFMEKVPSSAAVNETVKISKKCGASYASGMINAILRKVSEKGLILPAEADEGYMSIKYSCPQWLINKWMKEYGKEDTENILKSALGKNDVYIRTNTAKIDSDSLIEFLKEEGVDALKSVVADALKIDFGGNDVEKLSAFKMGYFHVQDLACQLAVKALDIKKGNVVFDLCSAPGGKAFTAAEFAGKDGEVLAFDIYEKRTELIKKGAERLNLTNLKASVGDAMIFNENLGLADRVICDVPCSGLGIIGKKPEIKYKDPDEIADIRMLQYPILQNGSRYVKIGGKLLYSTCTLSKAENEKVCEKFLKENPNFEKLVPLPEISHEEYLTLMPHKNGTDGFFIALFERKE